VFEEFHAHGVRFQFPETWEINEDEAEHEFTVTVSSPETSFWALTLVFDYPSPQRLIDLAVQAFRDEYDEVDVYAADETVCNRAATSRNIEFVCLELLNSAFLRAFRTGRFTALVLYQGTDHELAATRDVLESILRSLDVEEGDTIIR